MDEFAMGTSTETSFYGRQKILGTRSVYPGFIGGSAAAVAGDEVRSLLVLIQAARYDAPRRSAVCWIKTNVRRYIALRAYLLCQLP